MIFKFRCSSFHSFYLLALQTSSYGDPYTLAIKMNKELSKVKINDTDEPQVDCTKFLGLYIGRE